MTNDVSLPFKGSHRARNALLFVLLIVAIFGAVLISRPSLQEVNATINKSLHKGMSIDQVSRYFAGNGIQYGLDKATNRLYATVHFLRGSFPPVQWDAQIVVYLDSDQRIDHIDVQAVGTGP